LCCAMTFAICGEDSQPMWTMCAQPVAQTHTVLLLLAAAATTAVVDVVVVAVVVEALT